MFTRTGRLVLSAAFAFVPSCPCQAELPPGALARMTFPGNAVWEEVRGVAVSRDGRFVAAVDSANGLYAWDSSSGRKVGERGRSCGGAPAVAFTPDSRTLATGEELWDVPKWARRPGITTDYKGCVHCAACGGKLLATGFDDTIRLWDPAAGKRLFELKGHAGPVFAVAVSPDGRVVASAGLDATLRLWDAETGKELRRLEGHRDQVRALAFSSDGKTLFSGSRDRTARCWDVAGGKEVRRFEGHLQGIEGLSLSGDNRTLATASDDGTVRLWDTAGGKERRRVEVSTRGVRAVALTPDGKSVISGDGDRQVRRWDTVTGKEQLAFPMPGNAGRSNVVCSVAFSPDGKTLATGMADRTVRLWDPATGRERRFLGRQVSEVWSVAFAPDGKTLASAGPWDGTIHLWDVEKGDELYRFGGEHCGGGGTLVYSADGKWLVSAADSGGSLHLWDAATGKHLWRLAGNPAFLIKGVALSPDGRLLASVHGDNTLRLRDVAVGKDRPFPLECGECVDFSPDGRLLAVAGHGGDGVALWDPAAGKELRRIAAHLKSVQLALFSPDGRTLATGHEGTVYLWEMATGQERAHYHEDKGNTIHSLAFRPDGRALASGSVDGTTMVWDVTGLVGSPHPAPKDATALWEQLADSDAGAAFRAVWQLADHPDLSLPLLRRHLRPAVGQPPGRIAGWVRDLDDEDFQVRERASRELKNAGEQAEAALRKALAESGSQEVRLRAGRLLKTLEAGLTPETVRLVRAVEVLEHVGTPEARELLETLTRGAAESRITREARAALVNLERRRKMP